MIAYYYYLLSNTYGPVPFKPNYIAPTDFNLADLMEGQRPYYEVVDWVDKELKEVAKIVPCRNIQKHVNTAVLLLSCVLQYVPVCYFLPPVRW